MYGIQICTVLQSTVHNKKQSFAKCSIYFRPECVIMVSFNYYHFFLKKYLGAAHICNVGKYSYGMVPSWCWHSSCRCPAVSDWVVVEDLVIRGPWWSIIRASSCNSQTVKNWIKNKNTNQKQTQSCPLLLLTNPGEEKAERRHRTKQTLCRSQWKILGLIHPVLQLPGVSTT